MILYYQWYRMFILITSITVTVFILGLLFRSQSHKYIDTIPLYFALDSQHFLRQNDEVMTNDQKSQKTPRVTCVVVLKASEGRLGNVMFKFASAYGIAKIHACSIYLDRVILNNLTSIFDIELTNQIDHETLERSAKYHTQTVRHSDCDFFIDLLAPNAVSYLELQGYWQAYGHFLQYLDELRYQFTFNDDVVHSISPFLGNYISDEYDDIDITRTGFHNLKRYIKTQSTIRWIGIHIRRGDFLSEESISFGHTVSTENYINRAMDYFNHRYANRTIFFVTSDDKVYCKELFRKETHVHITPKYYSPAEDLAILSLCHDTIVTGGTFGWWAGILAGGTVVHDITYPKKDSRLEAVCPRAFYFPPWFLFM